MSPVVHRRSIGLQLDDEIEQLVERKKLSRADAQLCRQLYLAIMCVQHPDRLGALPKSVRDVVAAWHKAKDQRWRSDPEMITRQVEIAEKVYGLKRSRGSRAQQRSAFEFAGARLGLSPNTVANKTRKKTRKRRSVTSRARKK